MTPHLQAGRHPERPRHTFAASLAALVVYCGAVGAAPVPDIHYYTISVDYAMSRLWVEARFSPSDPNVCFQPAVAVGAVNPCNGRVVSRRPKAAFDTNGSGSSKPARNCQSSSAMQARYASIYAIYFLTPL